MCDCCSLVVNRTGAEDAAAFDSVSAVAATLSAAGFLVISAEADLPEGGESAADGRAEAAGDVRMDDDSSDKAELRLAETGLDFARLAAQPLTLASLVTVSHRHDTVVVAPGGSASGGSFSLIIEGDAYFTDRFELLTFENWSMPEFSAENWGFGFHDVDGNGYLDFFANHHWNDETELILNLGTDTPEYVGYNMPGDKHSVTFFDFDQDGDADLFMGVGAYRGTATDRDDTFIWNQLHINTGSGFEEANSAHLLGIEDTLGRGRQFMPVNLDGDLVLYLGVNLRPDRTEPGKFFRYNPDTRVFDRIFPEGLEGVDAQLTKGVHFGMDTHVDLVNLNVSDNEFWVYENQGAGFGTPVKLSQGRPTF